MAVFICLYILGEFHSYIQYFFIISTFGTLSTSHPLRSSSSSSFYFLYNPWCSVGVALVCMDVGPSTSQFLRRELALPPLAAIHSQKLSALPHWRPPRCWLAQSCPGIMWTADSERLSLGSLSCPGDTISQSFPWSPAPWSLPHCPQCFLSHVDREDRDVPRGAGYSPLPLVLGTEPSHEPVAATVSWGKGMLWRRQRVALFPEFNDKCLEDNLMPCLLNRTTRVDSI